ncbi:hypothetical protein Q9L58_005845 [Maublancomyces gigas]|uniref:Uncharacterized protein n=1 Tax=Discina gigas TaxID=1032678 RepID=A0ABR3GGX7_9PEZI
MHMAAGCGHSDVVTALLATGANIEDTDVMRMTALHLAAANGNLATAEILLKNGAEIDAKCVEGTALQLAWRGLHGGMATVLVARGAQVTLRSCLEFP